MMVCCVCGEPLDFGHRPIGDILITMTGAKFICKECKKLKEDTEKGFVS